MEQMKKTMMERGGAARGGAGGERLPARDADTPAGDQSAGDKADNGNPNDSEVGKEKP
jgi:hypothetical protein